MGRLYCEHLTPIGERCEECVDPGSSEREDLVLRFMLANTRSGGENFFSSETLLEWAIHDTDVYLKWRKEQRD